MLKRWCHIFQELEAFMQTSGDAGVVVVSFGSMVANLTMERADVMATALGRIPQKVKWDQCRWIEKAGKERRVQELHFRCFYKFNTTNMLFVLWAGHLEVQRRTSEKTVGKHQNLWLDSSERPTGCAHTLKHTHLCKSQYKRLTNTSTYNKSKGYTNKNRVNTMVNRNTILSQQWQWAQNIWYFALI